MRKRTICLTAAAIVTLGWFGLPSSGQAVPQAAANNAPVFSADNQLSKPMNYREWVWLSSGLGMSYGPLAQSAGRANPPAVDNTFVQFYPTLIDIAKEKRTFKNSQ